MRAGVHACVRIAHLRVHRTEPAKAETNHSYARRRTRTHLERTRLVI